MSDTPQPRTVEIQLTDIANGGAAIGRDKKGQVYFVPFALPGERVRAIVTRDKGRYAQTRLDEVVKPSADRIEPVCQHFGVCGGCHFQHTPYEKQLALKERIMGDQLTRMGKLNEFNARPVWAHPNPYGYRRQMSYSPTDEGGLGFWAPAERRVIPIEKCHILHPQLQQLMEDVDLALPGLRKLTLHIGDDDALLLAFEINGVEPPHIEVDIPLSAVIVLPDRTTANLIGDNFTVMRVNEQDYRVTAGVEFWASEEPAGFLADTVKRYANLQAGDIALDLYSGVGLLTQTLAQDADMVHGIEINPDAVADAVVNLAATDNVALYEGAIEEILPSLDVLPDVVVVDPPAGGMSERVAEILGAPDQMRLIIIHQDVALLARDVKRLRRSGYRLQEIQPIDMQPQTFQLLTVSYWEK